MLLLLYYIVHTTMDCFMRTGTGVVKDGCISAL